MDALIRHSFFLFSSLSNTSFTTSSRRKIIRELLILVCFFLFTVKLETYISDYLISPLLNRLFGNNEDLKAELEKKEADLKNVRGSPAIEDDE
jgi:hypothetical protein